MGRWELDLSDGDCPVLQTEPTPCPAYPDLDANRKTF